MSFGLRRILSAVVLMGLMPLVVQASEVTQAGADKLKMQKAVERVRRDLASQSQEYNRVLKSLRNINREMKRFVEERSELDQERILTEAQMRTLAEKMKNLEAQLVKRRTQLLTKIGSMHKFNQEAWISFLLEARNSAQLERNMKVLGLIGNRDVQSMKDFSNLFRDLKAQRNQFSDRLTYLKGLQSKIQNMEEGLREQTDLRGQILGQLKDRQKQTVEKLRSLQERQSRSGVADATSLAESGVLDALLKNSFAEKKSHLVHPVDGRITQNYGVIRDNEYHLILSHRGLMYEAPLKTTVHSVFEGQVAHIGHFPEYGKFIVIDHGDHFYSVYAMLGETNLKAGDNVKEGQSLGSVGLNPFDGRSGLYFEIRHFAETVDPKGWMKGRVYEISNL